jgi:hypothetical protein
MGKSKFGSNDKITLEKQNQQSQKYLAPTTNHDYMGFCFGPNRSKFCISRTNNYHIGRRVNFVHMHECGCVPDR